MRRFENSGGDNLDSNILVAVLSVAGTVLGSLIGVISSAKMTSFRLSRLEQKVDKHNQLVERMAIAENSIKSVSNRLDRLDGDFDRISKND